MPTSWAKLRPGGTSSPVCTGFDLQEEKLEAEKQFGAQPNPEFVEKRVSPRHKLDVGIKIYSRNIGLLAGRTVDISESGIAAMFKLEVPLNEVVQLEFKLPHGPVAVRALVRQRDAFRYGFQFVEPNSDAQELIRRTCRDLSLWAQSH
jgi:PilZ domain